MKKMAIFFTVFCCLIYTSLTGNCPDTNIQAIVKERNEQSLLALASDLETCDKWQDSLSLVYHTLGVYYYSNRDYENATKYTQSAIEIRTRISIEKPIWELGLSYYNLGIFYEGNLQYYEAQKAMERCLEIYQEIEDKEWEYNALLALSAIHTALGDYEQSETLLQFIISDATDSTAFSKAEAYLNLSNLYLEQERYDESLKLSQQAAPVFASFDSDYNYANSLLNSTVALNKLGEYSQAVEVGQEAMKHYRAIEDDYYICLLSTILAIPYIRQNQLVSAEKVLNLALGISKEKGFRNLEAISYDNYGEWYLKKENYMAAAAAFEQSIFLHLPEAERYQEFPPKLIEAIQQTSTKYNLFIALYDYSRAALAAYAQNQNKEILQKALQYLRVGDVVVDQLRYNHSSEATKLFWRERVRPFYENAMAICYELQATDKAFYFLEKSKAILLLEALLSSKAQEKLPDSLRQQLRFLKGRISSQREELPYLEGEDKKQVLTDILALDKNLAEVEDIVMAAYPQYRSIMEQTEMIDLADFRNQQKRNGSKTFIHYSYGNEYLYALVMDASGERLLKLGESEKIEPLIEQYLSCFTAADRITNDPGNFLSTAHKLYQLLLAPLEIDPEDALLLVPDGTLAYLPFEALVSKHANSLASANYLLKEHLITYAFSATLFEQMCREKSNQSLEVLALAPFANYAYGDYAKLQFSNIELEAINRQFAVKSFQDENAKLSSFNTWQQAYGVLHLSTHAFSSFEEEQPRIIFADSILYLSDLYQMQIPANLVVLSACQSNIGELVAGEGVLGLGRGFCYAGANSIVASLWNLNDKHTSTVISHFYDQLAVGTPKSMALRDAKLSFINDPDIPAFQKSPYYWASLTYYGDDGAVEISPANRILGYILTGCGIVLALLAGLFLKNRLSKK